MVDDVINTTLRSPVDETRRSTVQLAMRPEDSGRDGIQWLRSSLLHTDVCSLVTQRCHRLYLRQLTTVRCRMFHVR